MERISIGFAAGQVLSLRVDEETLASLTSALQGQNLWHELKTDEGAVSLRVDHIVYLRTEDTGTKVGFGL